MFGKAKGFQIFIWFYFILFHFSTQLWMGGSVVSTTGCFFLSSIFCSGMNNETHSTYEMRLHATNYYGKLFSQAPAIVVCTLFVSPTQIRTVFTYSWRWKASAWRKSDFPRRNLQCLPACLLGNLCSWRRIGICKLRRRAPYDWMYWNHLSMEFLVLSVAKASRGIASKWISGSLSAYIVAATDRNELPNWWVRWRIFWKRISHVAGSVRAAVLFHFSQTDEPRENTRLKRLDVWKQQQQQQQPYSETK